MPSKKSTTEHSVWPIVVVLLVLCLAVSIFLNVIHGDNSINKIAGTLNVDNGDQKINWSQYTENTTIDLKSSGSVNITKSGIYYFVGSLEDGMISIDVGNKGVVKLVLNNVNLTNTQGPAIACFSGDDLVIELVGKNTLTDSSTYPSNYDEDIKGAIYSKADTTFTGDGELILDANYSDGIVSKDDLKFTSGTYQITAKDDAIRGKDSVYIVSGNFELDAGADAIKTTNKTDNNKGFILIENGSFDIISSAAKGLKATNNILIYDGNFNIESYDDAIHSNNYVGINDGEIIIESGDDGVHADRELIINGGTISITKSYEGLEAQKVTLNNGEISIIASDDGINAGGGSDSSANNRPGAGAFKADENCEIIINDGKISINASGDGIDSNGAIYINGGNVVVDGPTNNGNGALDANTEVYIHGGEVIAIGSSGMAVSFSQDSSVFSLSIYLDSIYPAGTKIAITNSAGEKIISHRSPKTFSHVVIGSEKLLAGESYSILINNETYKTFTISEITTTIGDHKNDFNNDFRR